MPLGPGARLGPYEITSAIGAGGMGEVYRARDTKLGRDVALKIISETFALDPDRLARFKREAQLLTSLNHPNIAAIHGFEDSSDVHALVLELVEGPTLAERIKQGPIPIDETLDIAAQIAAALDAAHERGIVHRDLKPANIKLTEEGTVKVLDFGLAKALAGETAPADISLSPTMTSPAVMTGAGVILETAAYMAPEQARGKPTDRRADIWAFGCVLFEMVTGKRAFEAEEASDTLAAILRGEPDWSIVPARLRPLLRACLEKDRKQRLQSIADSRLLLNEPPVGAAVSSGRPVVWMIGTGVATLVALMIGIAHFLETPPVEPVRRFSIVVPESSRVGFLALSGDGRQLVTVLPSEVGNTYQLWRRSLDSTQLQSLNGTTNPRAPFWSPDARFIGFFADGKLKTIPSAGGPVQALCDAGPTGGGGTWNNDGLILFGNSASRSIERVQASGGSCTPVLKGDNNSPYSNPVFLPDGRHFLYVHGNPDTGGLFVGALGEGSGIRLLPDRSSGLFAASQFGGTRGHLLFLRESTLMAQPFDSSTSKLEGDPMVVAEDASFTLNTGQLAASVDSRGTLVYLAQPPRRNQLTWFDRRGKEQGRIGVPQDQRHVAFPPDQQRVATLRQSQGGNEIWVRDLARDTEARFTIAPAMAPVWAPDGLNIAFSTRGDLHVKDTGGGEPKALVQNSNSKTVSDWSHDGRTLVYTETNQKTRGDIWLLLNPLGSDTSAVPFLRTEANESQGRISPDGRWIAYASDESGQNEVYVRPFPSGAGKWRVSNNQGAEPSWRQDGTELFYTEAAGTRRRIVAVPTRSGPELRFEAGVPMPMFDFPVVSAVTENNVFIYGPSRDGSRFLADVQVADSQPTLNVITNWQQLVAVAPTR